MVAIDDPMDIRPMPPSALYRCSLPLTTLIWSSRWDACLEPTQCPIPTTIITTTTITTATTTPMASLPNLLTLTSTTPTCPVYPTEVIIATMSTRLPMAIQVYAAPTTTMTSPGHHRVKGIYSCFSAAGRVTSAS